MKHLIQEDYFPTAKELNDARGENLHNYYDIWKAKAKKYIIFSERRGTPYCHFHLKYYINDTFDHVYASIVEKDIKVINKLNKEVEEEIQMLISFLTQLGYQVTPFVGEKPYEMDRCNMSTTGKDQNTFVGHGALGLYITW